MRKIAILGVVAVFSASCGVTYTVRIQDKNTGNPLKAQVKVKKESKVVKEAEIDGEGKLSLGRGEFVLSAVSEGYFEDSVRISPENKDITLALEPRKYIFFKIVDERDENKLVPSNITVLFPNETKIDTSVEGMLLLTDLREGTYTYVVRAEEYDSVKNSIELTKSETVLVKLKYIMSTVKVRILDEKGNPIENANLVFKGRDGKTYNATTDANGEAVVKVPYGPYTVEAYKEGYVPNAKIVELQPGESSLDLTLGRSGLFKVYFDFDMYDIRSDSKTTLDVACDLFKQLASETDKFRIKVEGHADQRGTDAYNYRLSKNRAEAVKNYLVETCGIDERKIRIVAFGERKPEDRACNMRNKEIWENTSDNSPIVWFRWDRDKQMEQASPCQKNRRSVVLTKRYDRVKARMSFGGGLCTLDGYELGSGMVYIVVE